MQTAEQYKQWHKTWYQTKGKTIVSEYNKNYAQTLKGRFNLYKAHSKRRGIEMNLTLSEFSEIVSKPCTYCGISGIKLGIDRLDNNIGYLKQNSVSCCKVCNFMKKSMTHIDFLNHIKKIIINNLFTN